MLAGWSSGSVGRCGTGEVRRRTTSSPCRRKECGALEEAAPRLSYGWGMVPARVRLGATEWTTSLWPKDGGYVVPLKDRVRRVEDVEVGDTVTLSLVVDL